MRVVQVRRMCAASSDVFLASGIWESGYWEFGNLAIWKPENLNS
jgi:hypothetical protein